jgi:hypothetical protein
MLVATSTSQVHDLWYATEFFDFEHCILVFSQLVLMPDLQVLRRNLQPHLERLLVTRDYPKTICPSEVARALNTADLQEADISSWRDAMPEVRKMIAEMRERGEVEVLQKGSILEGDLGVGLERVVGPIRIRKIQ